MTCEEEGITYYLQSPKDHQKVCVIGIKRYAGLYCFDCNASLLTRGEDYARESTKWHGEKCVLCNKNEKNIDDCACFDWIMARHRLEYPRFSLYEVVDEYGVMCTLPEFYEKIVKACPIQFYDRITH
jgi:hypothetical protein